MKPYTQIRNLKPSCMFFAKRKVGHAQTCGVRPARFRPGDSLRDTGFKMLGPIRVRLED